MRVFIQIMSSESFQEIMTQELGGPREHSWNEDFQVAQSKPSYLWPSDFFPPLFFPLWLWDCCCCLITESCPTLFHPMDWKHARPPYPSVSPGVCPSLIMGWHLRNESVWESRPPFLKQPHCCCRTPLWAQNQEPWPARQVKINFFFPIQILQFGTLRLRAMT